MRDLVLMSFFLGVIAYAAATTLFVIELARREVSGLGRAAARTLTAAAALHGLHVVSASLLSRVCPVESVHFALSLTALIAVIAYLTLRRRLRVHAIGVAVAPLALVFLVSAQFVGATAAPVVSRGILAVHVTANLLGVGLFLLAGAAALFYLFEERRLRTKRTNWLTARLPPLDALDKTEHRLLLVGFPLLTLGIASGGFVSGELGASGGAELTRAILAYGAWLVVAVVLLLRAVSGWRGRRAAYGTVAGAICVLLVILLYSVRPSVGVGS